MNQDEDEIELIKFTKEIALIGGTEWSEVIESLVLNAYREGLKKNELLFCEEHTPRILHDWQKGNCLKCAKKIVDDI